MKKGAFIFLCFAFFSCNTVKNNIDKSKVFISIWDTTQKAFFSSLKSNQIKLPLEKSGTYDFIVNWGDETQARITQFDDPEAIHSYEKPGIYEVEIRGTIIGFKFDYNSDNKLKILEIKSWGPLQLGNSGEYFYEAKNLIITASDSLDLKGTTNLNGMFYGCTSFNGNISNWDTSNVKNMSSVFFKAESFNGNISAWDTSNVKDMSYMFHQAKSFNGDLSNSGCPTT